MSKESLIVIAEEFSGIKAALKARRENPEMDITVITRQGYVSSIGYKLPYYLSGAIKDRELFFKEEYEYLKATQNIDILLHHNVLEILPMEKKLIVEELSSQRRKEFDYDKLVLATGAFATKTPIEGINLKNIIVLDSIDEVLKLRRRIEQGTVKRAVVAGADSMAIEVAENLVLHGVPTVVVAENPFILDQLDPDMSLLAQRYMEGRGVEFVTGEKVLTFIGNIRDEVVEVHTPERIIGCDLVVWCQEVKPRVELAAQAGIRLGTTGAIAADEFAVTNFPDILAIGDCTEKNHLITGKAVWYPASSSVSNAAWVAGVNSATGDNRSKIKGVMGTMAVKLFQAAAVKVGLSTREGELWGFPTESILVSLVEKDYYISTGKIIYVKMIVDSRDHRVLGAQIIGEGEVDKAVNTLVTLISFQGTVEDITSMDYASSPIFAESTDPILVAANVMFNKFSHGVKGISSLEFHKRLKEEEFVILDVREKNEAQEGQITGSLHFPLYELEGRVVELPKDKPIVIVSNTGRKAYLAYRLLKKNGFDDIAVLEGGLAAYPFEII